MFKIGDFSKLSEVYLKGPDRSGDSDPSKFVTEVQCPVEKA